MSEKIIKLNISGMTCVNCSNAVEKVSKKINGVKEAKVSFTNSSGEFIVDSSVDEEKIIEKIERLGYGVAVDEKSFEQKLQESFEKLRKRFLVAAFFTSILFICEHFYSLNELSIWIMFLCASIVQIYSGGDFYFHAYSSFKNKNYDMNVLVVLGTTAAYSYSVLGFLLPNFFPKELNYLYFGGSAMIITFILLGKYLEAKSKESATDFLKKLMNLSPEISIKLDANGLEKEVDSKKLQIEDIIVVKPGNRISADGVIIEGGSEIDYSMLTGESMPIFKTVGDNVNAGVLNINGFLKIKVTKLPSQTVLSKIISLLKTAGSHKMPISRLADKIANIFVPTVVGISILTLFVWLVFKQDLLYASLAAVSVLIISCPCALGLATPIAVVSGLAQGAKYGILIKNPEILEILKDVKYAIFDKTGTLTKGKISVQKAKFEDKIFIETFANLAILNEHPSSKAVVKYAINLGFKPQNLQCEFEQIIGKGIRAKLENKEYLLGNSAFLEENNVAISEEYKDFINEALSDGKSGIYGSIDGKCEIAFILEDELKENSIATIQDLKKYGITPIMLTGDNKKTAKKIARDVGIEEFYSEILPEDKFNYIKKFQEKAKVLFIGDGINDSLSLKQADIGIALNSGSDIAKDSGDVVLVNDDIKGVSKALNLGNLTMNVIKQNLFWAFIYNIIGIPLAAGILYPHYEIMLSPMYAGMAMSFSSVMVVLNSLRLRFKKL